MFDTQTKSQGVNIRIYRDARLVALLWLTSSLFFALPAIALKDKVEMLAALSILTAGDILVCLVFWYLLHGAIVLNKPLRQVEFMKDIGLHTPHARYLVDAIDRVMLEPLMGVGNQGFLKGCKIALKLKRAQDGELDLFFLNEAAGVQAAKTVAEFACVPAYDLKGRQIFSPKGY